MKRSILIVRSVAGVLWIVLMILGITFWTGHALNLVPFHMAIGGLFVLALWTLAILSARAGAPPALVALTLAWGAIIPLLGFFQYQLLPGPFHWVIKVLHLVVGLVAMPLAGRLTVASGAAGAGGPGRRRVPAPTPQVGQGRA